MFCTKCGHPNADNSAFCSHCGAALIPPTATLQQTLPPQPRQYAQPQQSAQPQQGQYYQQSSPAFPPARKKSKAGLVIGLIAGFVVLCGLAAMILLNPGGEVPALGVWYSDEYGEVIDFQEKGKVEVYTGEEQNYGGTYIYNEKKGTGVLYADENSYKFTVKADELVIEGKRRFVKAESGFDIEKFMNGPSPTVKPQSSAKPDVQQPTEKPTAAPVKSSVVEQDMTLQLAFGKRTGFYTGELVNGLPDGAGSFTTQSPEGTSWTYEGNWKQGHFSGEGATYWEDGFTESGWYDNDALNGQGQESWYDRLQYEGGYKNSEFHGKGTLYNGYEEAIYVGEFENGFLLESSQDRADRVGAFKDQSIEPTHEELYSACAERTSIRVQVTGQVSDVYCYPETDPNYCYIYIFNPNSNDYEVTGIFYYLTKGEAPPQKDQIITVWGTAHSLYTYTTEENTEWTIPQVMAWSVE